METNWIKFEEQKPTLNDEYIVAIDLDDEYDTFVTAAAEYNLKQKKWFYPNTKEEVSTVIFWSEFPLPPFYQPKLRVASIPPRTISEFEGLAYGQCPHGENMVNCSECNPNK